MRRWYRSGAFPVHRHSLVQLIVDGALVALAYMLAFELRFDNGIPGRYDLLRDETILWVVPLCVAVFAAFGLYQRLWTYVGQRDYEALLRAVVVSAILVVGGISFLHPVQKQARNGVELAVGIPMGVAAMWVLLTLFLTAGVRFLAHLVFEGRAGRGPRMKKGARTVLIVGGGDGGRLVVRELVRNPDLGLRPIGFLDDDPRKRGMKDEHHLRVLGTTSDADLRRVLDTTTPDEVIVAIPSAPGTLRGRIVAACRPRGIPVRTLPTVFELLQDGETGGLKVMRQLRELQVEDVLGREPVRMELDRVGAYLANQVVLVTGAGGSIGGELCRQIARVGPRKLVLVDHAEDNLFEILRELEDERHVRTAVPVLADCKEEERMREVFAEHRPAIVFHAAAYKHVGMMELNPVEAVRNNALATRLVTRIAGEAGVKTFVLVSTDKAVSPATVMGASKALAEWAVEAAAERHPGTRFSTVRFGNVLGSSGSVVPIFRRQIAAGGPVTVTDARMQRYFMTIPEAVQLIIRSGSLSERSGEVFVLEMGEPVQIVELAKAMIRLSGFEPDTDIAIEVVGAKPGEKLHEELFNPYERPQPTPAEKILRADRPRLDPDWVERTFADINLFVLEDDAAALAAKVSELSAIRTAPAGRAAADRRPADPVSQVPSSDA
jgi:FlaA1/EpsC-like NDP-sugar epimerase